MIPARRLLQCALVLSPWLSTDARAHFFVQPYTLPVPFSMYAYGAAAALLLSFIVVGFFATVPVGAASGRSGRATASVGPARRSPWLPLARGFAVFLLLLCIVAGFAGTQRPLGNINMTLFWIVFVLGVPYAVALLGDFYAAVNPWRTLAEVVERATGRTGRASLPYPVWLSYTPALLLYMAFIWLELFGRLAPLGLSVALLVYSAIQLIGARLFGVQAWMQHGEFFGVLLRLLGRMSPWGRPAPAAASRGASAGKGAPRRSLRSRLPFTGLIDEPVTHMSLVLFVLFMLSSTAYDGLHSTAPWAAAFWKQIYPQIGPWFPAAPGRTYAVSTQLYYAWQWLSLLASPLVYLAAFAACMWGARLLTGSTLPVRTLVLRFASCLVPIAFVYHLTHYYTLLLAQGGQLLRQFSDPLGRGWNLFGTATLGVEPLVLEVETIWHSQVLLILAGHIVSVYLAHLVALRTFDTPRRAILSQAPMLVLMMLFTTFGLWILSMPLATGG